MYLSNTKGQATNLNFTQKHSIAASSHDKHGSETQRPSDKDLDRGGSHEAIIKSTRGVLCLTCTVISNI